MKNMAKSNNEHEVTRQSMNLFSVKFVENLLDRQN